MQVKKLVDVWVCEVPTCQHEWLVVQGKAAPERCPNPACRSRAWNRIQEEIDVEDRQRAKQVEAVKMAAAPVRETVYEEVFD